MTVRMRHLQRPIRAARTLTTRAVTRVKRESKLRRTALLKRRYEDIERVTRERCWCSGDLRSFPWHASYGVCLNCGCYVNRRPPSRAALKEFYSFERYWHRWQNVKGLPLIEARAAHDRDDGRVHYWMRLVESHVSAGGRVIDIGCGPGVCLSELAVRGFRCTGVEPDAETARWVTETTGIPVLAGMVPGVALPPAECILAFDVLEHVPDPGRFVDVAAQALVPGGTLIVQTPIDRYDEHPPFKDRFDDAFDDLEHLFIYTDRSMQELGHRSRLELIDDSQRWRYFHEVVVYKKPFSA